MDSPTCILCISKFDTIVSLEVMELLHADQGHFGYSSCAIPQVPLVMEPLPADQGHFGYRSCAIPQVPNVLDISQ